MAQTKTKNKSTSLLSSGSPLLTKPLVALFVMVVAGAGYLAVQASQAATESGFKVKALVLTTFDGETQPWLTHESWPLTFTVIGAHDPVHCQKNGICVTTTGTGKSNAGPSLAAILDSPLLNTSSSYFITAGIAGTRPTASAEGTKGTLGFAGIANWVVDGDLGTKFDSRDVASKDPSDVKKYAWYYLQDYENGQFHLNETLAAQAYAWTKDLVLADDADAQNARAAYPEQAGMKPFVARCDTMGADNFFSGTHDADTMDHIVRVRSNGAATKCTSEFEDPGYANTLRLRNKLDHYISVRTASDFETPPAGVSAYDLLTKIGYPGYSISTENEYRVGSKIAHELAKL
jgi:purine nucleoside permease